MKDILESKPIFNKLDKNCGFVGSKWGVPGRGNIDAWYKYLTPLEKHNFDRYGLPGRMLSDKEMVETLRQYKICPIIHAPSWVSERGVQDRFYTVFISGRFGVCDNLGAIDIMGNEIADICTTDPEEYYKKTIFFMNNTQEQKKYIDIIQKKNIN